jgi:hypothetical protein
LGRFRENIPSGRLFEIPSPFGDDKIQQLEQKMEKLEKRIQELEQKLEKRPPK